MKVTKLALLHIFFVFVLYSPSFVRYTLCEEDVDVEVTETPEEKEEEVKLSEEELLNQAEDPVLLSEDDISKLSKTGEHHEYQAEITRLLDIIVNSLYSSKEIFLRELISNSADALEKYKIFALQNDYEDKGEELNIKIRAIPNKRILTIMDNGIGMTKHDLINNLGTIAKSGTANFLDALNKGEGDASLIGQFGVGFYSAFLVADTVIVQSKHSTDKQYVWKSSADANYELYEDPKGDTLGAHGTLITLKLREDATNYLKPDVLQDLVKKYSQFVKHPIKLYKLSKDGESVDWAVVNDVPPIWTRDKTTITPEEYISFYKAISGHTEDPLTHIHFSAEGDVDFKALLYIPARPANIYFDSNSKEHNVKIYSRRVLVSEELPDFIPRYLFSIYGVVDSDSFPLNVSREHLQQSKLIKVIGKKIVRTVLDTLLDLMKKSDKSKKALKEELEAETDEEKKKEIEKKIAQPTEFDKFYSSFKGALKVGCYDDDANRKKIAKLLKYKTSKHKDTEITLEQYIAEMPENQKDIYYASGDSYKEIKNIPHLQGFVKRDLDVLFLMDTMDESCLTQLMDYEGKRFKSIQKGEISFDLTEEEKEEEKKKIKKYKPLTKVAKKMLPELLDVKVSRRLTDDPCTVVASEWGMTAHMEKLVKSYVVHKQEDSFDVASKFNSRILEINPDHPIMIELLKRAIKDPESSDLKRSILLLYNAAKLASGFIVENPKNVVQSAYKYLNHNLGVDASSKLEDVQVEESETEEEKPEDPGTLDIERLIESNNVEIDDEVKESLKTHLYESKHQTEGEPLNLDQFESLSDEEEEDDEDEDDDDHEPKTHEYDPKDSPVTEDIITDEL